MLWDGKFLQIDGDLAFRSTPQQIQVKVENIFLFLLMAGEDPSIIKYKFRDKNFQLAVSFFSTKGLCPNFITKATKLHSFKV
jgi:hypothetical protein